ncbi:MAG: hypothetical protein AAF633_16505, partial [Chloroflexota bacterium]
LIPAVYDMAVENKWQIRELRPEIQTLESVFNQLALSVDPSDYEDELEDDDLLETEAVQEEQDPVGEEA